MNPISLERMATDKTKQIKRSPLPLFDSAQYISQLVTYDYLTATYCIADIEQARSFLAAYRHRTGTFTSYRREIERLIH